MDRGSESDASGLLPRRRAIDQNKYFRDAATVIPATAQKASQQQNRTKRIMMALPLHRACCALRFFTRAVLSRCTVQTRACCK
jgi:hypothetical protein